jgi:hypothetical protein
MVRIVSLHVDMDTKRDYPELNGWAGQNPEIGTHSDWTARSQTPSAEARRLRRRVKRHAKRLASR